MRIKYGKKVTYCKKLYFPMYIDNVLKMFENLKDDKLDGEFKYYYDDGIMWEDIYYKNDKQNGEYKCWYKNGQLYDHCYYKDNILNGKYEKYYEDGNIKIESNYVNGKLDGIYKEYKLNKCKKVYYKNGIKMEEI